MRRIIINFLKNSPIILKLCWKLAELGLKVWSIFIPIKEKTILFASFGGRKFDDSPRALYEEILRREEFKDWTLVWAFVEPDKFEIPRGEKVKMDTPSFFKLMISSKVLISNSGMTRGIKFKRKGVIRVETWHGTPLKKIGGEENQNSLGGKKKKTSRKLDTTTIRCAQSEFDQEIFARIFNASKDTILLSDLPRNDALIQYSEKQILDIRRNLGIADGKKIILYTPTYREYLVNENKDTYLLMPINFEKWKKKLGKEYVLLVRAHYAVSVALSLKNDDFVMDVSTYPMLNDLYIIADMMISDYSSTFFDYSILCRPMFCYAYDLEEYEEKRGLYLNLSQTLPCSVDKTEDELIEHILSLNAKKAIHEVEKFHKIYTPYAGHSSEMVVNELVRKLVF